MKMSDDNFDPLTMHKFDEDLAGTKPEPYKINWWGVGGIIAFVIGFVAFMVWGG